MTVSSSEHFSKKELECKCGCGQGLMDAQFITRLEALRTTYGKSIVLSSAYRCPAHNEAVSSTGTNGPHTTGRAVDIAVNRGDALKIIELALGLGFTGFGVLQKGVSRFIHLDDLEATNTRLRPTIWSY